ncbi:phage tail protein [Escherichia coli]
MATKYFALLTNIGAAKLANATALGAQVEITQMAVGDGNGALPTPNPAQTALVHELRRAQLNMLTVDPVNTNQIIAEQVIPEDAGGWWIREIGLFDKDGDMIAVANCAETYKPQLQEGSGRVQVIRVILIVSSTEAVTLKIDPSVVLATRKYVDDAVIEVKAYADDVMKKHVAAANPHKQYPLIANALKEMVDAGLVNQVLQNLGLADAIHGVSCDAAGFSGGDTAQPYFRHVDGSLVPLATHSYTQTGLDGRQPKDATLTNLSGKDVAGLLQYLGLTKAVVVENQGSNANGKWRKYTDGTFEASGFISADPATGIAIVPLPVQFPAAPTTILVTQYIHDTSSRPGLTTVINSLSGATGFQTMSVDLTGAPYALGFAWRATYAPF